MHYSCEMPALLRTQVFDAWLKGLKDRVAIN